MKLYRQELHDYWHKLNSAMGDYLVLLEQGESSGEAHEKAHSTFHKWGPEMRRVANQLGNRTPKIVNDYLDSMESILHSQEAFVDRAKVTMHFEKNQRLQKAL